MSGVLDRMVQRSRGHLPAIEPLVRAQQTAAAALPFAVEASAAAASRTRDAASPGRQRALSAEPAAAVRDNVRNDVAQASEPTRKDSRRSEALDEFGRVKGAAESGGTAAANDADSGGLKRAKREAQESAEVHESTIEMRSEKMSAKSEETAGESIRTKARVERAATPDTPAARNETGDATSEMGADEHTEIHITIGSVELIAPRIAPAPPKVPAFRPRVTLDEFLKRGAGSGGRGAQS